MRRKLAPSIAVIQDYEVAWAKAYGLADADTGQPATTETLFQAASISKPVTATAALRRVEDGSFDLDAPIKDVLKSWQLPDVHRAIAEGDGDPTPIDALNGCSGSLGRVSVTPSPRGAVTTPKPRRYYLRGH